MNAIIAKLDDGKHVFFLDIGAKFMEPDGSLTKEIMPDFLHLSPKGYQIWADAISPKLTELMKWKIRPARFFPRQSRASRHRAENTGGTTVRVPF